MATVATTTAALSKGPTSEIGYANFAGPSVLPWRMLIDNNEYVPELRFPQSIDTYDQMRSDAKVEGILLALTLPVIRYKWQIDPNGARPEVYRPLADDLGLPILGEETRPRLRSRGKFKHEAHMWQAMLALCFGFHPFELVGHYPSGKSGLWRLSKVAPRPPWTISRIDVDEHGDLAGMEQRYGIDTPPIPGSSLVPYTWKMEGANWYGRSILRPAYKPWVIKDRVMRIAAMAIERNGVGVPTIEMAPGASQQEIDAANSLAQAYRAGDMAGAAIVNGKLTLQGVRGTTAPWMDYLRYLDEQFSHATITQFMDLGSTKHGSRALGGEFIDFFMQSQETTGGWYRDTTNDYIIERWVDINFGESETAPKLVFERNEDPALAVAPLVALIESGAVTLDVDLENQIRDRFGLTQRKAGDAVPAVKTKEPSPLGPTSLASAQRRIDVAVRAASSGDGAAGIPAAKILRRDPHPHEVASGVDPGAIDAVYQDQHHKLLVAWWKTVTQVQIDAVYEQILNAKTLVDLASVTAPIGGEQLLADAITKMAEHGRDFALAELGSQGATDATTPTLDGIATAISDRATALAAAFADALAGSASQLAIIKSGEGIDNKTVADFVKTTLEDKKFVEQGQRIGGALHGGFNSGRGEVFVDLPADTRFYANETLDDRTCEPCIDIDLTEYASYSDAERDYPGSSGFTDCLGLDKCRGLVVAVLGAETPASVQGGE